MHYGRDEEVDIIQTNVNADIKKAENAPNVADRSGAGGHFSFCSHGLAVQGKLYGMDHRAVVYPTTKCVVCEGGRDDVVKSGQIRDPGFRASGADLCGRSPTKTTPVLVYHRPFSVLAILVKPSLLQLVALLVRVGLCRFFSRGTCMQQGIKWSDPL